VDTLVEELVVDGCRRFVDVGGAVEDGTHGVAFGLGECPWLRLALLGRLVGFRGLAVTTVVVGLRPAGRLARRPY
jgi:hypothetical protein